MVHTPAVSSTIIEGSFRRDGDLYQRGVAMGFFAFGDIRFLLGQLVVAPGFTGAVSPTNTLTPVNTADVISFGDWAGYDITDPGGSTLIYCVAGPGIFQHRPRPRSRLAIRHGYDWTGRIR
jgi:hypothetical protein